MHAFIPLVFDPDGTFDVPWNTHATHGGIRSLDGAPTSPFTRADVDRIVAYGSTAEHDWDGHTACVALLTDGRYLSWDSWWGPTGSGFHEDAYGGDQEVMVALDPCIAIAGIPEQRRELLRFATDESERALVDVLYDAHMQGESRQRLVAIARESGEFGALVEYRVDELIHRWPVLQSLLTGGRLGEV